MDFGLRSTVALSGAAETVGEWNFDDRFLQQYPLTAL